MSNIRDYKINTRLKFAIAGMNKLIANKYLQLRGIEDINEKNKIEEEIERYKIFKDKITVRNIKIIENYEKNYAPIIEKLNK